MAINISIRARNAACNAINNLVNQGSTHSGGYIEIRTGSKPSSPLITPTGTILAVHYFSNPAFKDSVNGSSISNEILREESVKDTGTAGWFRLYDRDGNTILDGDVSKTGGSGDIKFDNTEFVVGGKSVITSMNLTVPERLC